MEIHEQPTTPWQPGDIAQEPTVSMPAPGAKTTVQLPGGGTGAQQPKKRGLSRRKLTLGLVGAGVAAAAGGVGIAQMVQRGGLNNVLHGPMASNVQIGHLLRRAGFGATSDDLATYAPLGYNGAVDRLVNYQQIPDDAMESRLKGLNLDLTKVQDIQQWWLMRMAWTQRPLLEKMTLFWHGVLVSSYRKAGGKMGALNMANQNQFLRAHAFDTYDNILLGITADPAMLYYLDLTHSTKNAPNENYARELMELFTLGLGHYSQQDVFEGAAALTGWHVFNSGTQSHFVERDHNTLSKTYLGQTGNFDYKDVVRILANHQATPWFLARKLFTFFAYENPTNEDLNPLVDAYVKSNHNMGEVMKALLLSPQFSSSKAYRSRVKSPVEFVVGTYRALNMQGAGKGLPAMTTVMGQTVFDPPNVAGWPADKVSTLWLNSGTWMTRLNYVDQLLLGARYVGGSATTRPLDLQAVVDTNKIDSPEHFVDYYSSFLFDGSLTTDRRTQFIEYFTSKDPKSAAQVKLTNGQSYPLSRVRGTVYLMLASPEYQLN
ncbi:MAG TPA: DUF1800 domain-containing protein [Ktedonosporobacter sp.]|nr:DUF1800 domain-containing protein [Ktedonosporobacter sp.]